MATKLWLAKTPAVGGSNVSYLAHVPGWQGSSTDTATSLGETSIAGPITDPSTQNTIFNSLGGGNQFWVTRDANSSLIPPVTVTPGVTISGPITISLRAREFANTANATVCARLSIENIPASTFIVLVAFFDPPQAAELTTTDATVNLTFTPTTPYVTQVRDYFSLQVAIRDGAGVTMAAGSTVTLTFGGTTAGASGDSFISFTEDDLVTAERESDRVPVMAMRQAVARAASWCWTGRKSGIVVPRLWTPEVA